MKIAHPSPSAALGARLAFALALGSSLAPLPAEAQRPRERTPSRYDTWIRSFPELDVRQRSPWHDPDGDDLDNLEEQLLQLDPGVPLALDPRRDNAPAIDWGPRGEPRWRYRVDPDAESEIRHQAQVSTTFGKWESAATVRAGSLISLPFDPRQEERQLFRILLSHEPPDESLPLATFSTRGEETLGDFQPGTTSWGLSDAAKGDWRANHGDRWTNLRGGAWRKMAANFLVEGDAVPVSILFSAEAYVEQPDRHLFVRLLLDGQPMNPGDVLFVRGGGSETRAARSMEFTGLCDRGLHTVEAQWLADAGASGFIRDAALLIRQGDVDHSRGALLGFTPDSGPAVETDSDAWSDVPGLKGEIQTHDERDCLTATVSAEAFADPGESLMLRVIVDGVVADPGEVEFVRGRYEGTRTMVFGIGGRPVGTHDVRVQWRSATGATASLGDRTLTLAVGSNANDRPVRKHFLSGDDEVPAPVEWADVPGLSQAVIIPADSDLSVVFSAEFPEPAGTSILARLRIGGTVVPESEVMLTDGNAGAGVHAFAFDAKHVGVGGPALFTTVSVEWMAASRVASASIRARSMLMQVKDHAVPDLAEPMRNGLGLSAGGGLGVEPMRGDHHVLFILWDPKRDPAANPVPSIAEIEEAAFGASDSIADYFEEISGDRFELVNAGVLGPYDADENWQNYWNGPGDHQDKWDEAVTKADADFDFSAYDFNGDGYLAPWNELAVVIVIPQGDSAGFVRPLWSGATPETRDGVYLDWITEWYVSDPIADFSVGAHELGHQILVLGDLYEKTNGASQIGTRPGDLCLMDATDFETAPHLNPAWKLSLGWVTPRIVSRDGSHALGDVKTSREVVILPRVPSSTTNDEYVVLENRPAPANSTRYDFPLPDEGIAVWHIVESPLDTPNPPPCDLGGWNAQTANGTDLARAGVRLVRPGILFSAGNSLWNSSRYDLDPFGLTCPPGADTHNVLRWADGTNSWSIRNWSAPGAVMSFDVFAP